MIGKVISEGFCIKCSNCTVIDPSTFSYGDGGVIKIKNESKNDIDSIGEFCPFSGISKDEDILAEEKFSGLSNYDDNIGYFDKIYAGWDADNDNRLSSSSGGLVTALIKYMIDSNIIDGAILAIYDSESALGVRYVVTSDFGLIEKSRQSKYILVDYGDALKEILAKNGKYAFVGIPCHIKAINLLGDKFSEINEKIKYKIAVFCGHQKNTYFKDYVGWTMGVVPSDQLKLTFRVKKKAHDAGKYFYKIESKAGYVYENRVDKIKWLDWGLGLFKYKACDYCDDVSGETADIIFGDAWTKKYAKDYRGTNIVISRSVFLSNVLEEMFSKGKIFLEEEGVSLVMNSQGGNFRHRKEGVLTRIANAESGAFWYPKKRPSLEKKFSINNKRKEIYLMREKISMMSHHAYESAVEAKDLNVFYNKMDPLIGDYYSYLNKNMSFLNKIKKYIKNLIK